MYRVAFGYVTSAPTVALALASVFVVVSQVKINITNAYAGSIAWSNFFCPPDPQPPRPRRLVDL